MSLEMESSKQLLESSHDMSMANSEGEPFLLLIVMSMLIMLSLHAHGGSCRRGYKGYNQNVLVSINDSALFSRQQLMINRPEIHGSNVEEHLESPALSKNL